MPDWLPTFEKVQPWHWWVLGSVLLILEVTAPGMFFVWLALAAFGLGLIVFILPLSVPVQLLFFAVLCVLSVFVGRRYVNRITPDTAGSLNEGAGRLVGRTVTVTTPIVNGLGRVRVGDSDWRARGPDTELGKSVLIVATEGTTLIVREISGHWV